MARARQHVLPTALTVALVCLSVGTASASADQIVWQKDVDGSFWAMNDDGTNPHRLIGVSDIPGFVQSRGDGIFAPDVLMNGGTSLVFTGTTYAYDEGAFYSHQCGVGCEGNYLLAGGVLKRLSGGPAACNIAHCSTFEDHPRVMADGQSIAYQSSISSGYGGSISGSGEMDTRGFDGSAPSVWNTDPSGSSYPTTPTPNPVDPTRLLSQATPTAL